MFRFCKRIALSAFALAAAVAVSLVGTQAHAVAPDLDPTDLTGVDLSGYATTIGTVLGELLGTIIVVALAFVVIKKGFRALSSWIKA